MKQQISIGGIPVTTQAQPQVEYDKDRHVLIRGFPRLREKVEQVEKEMQAKLVSDMELDLLLKLDTALRNIARKINTNSVQGFRDQYPDYLSMPGETDLFIPIPFEVRWQGIKMQSFHKPAWFRVPRKFSMGAKVISKKGGDILVPKSNKLIKEKL